MTADQDSDADADRRDEVPYMLALFDVLGFSNWLERAPLQDIVAAYERLLAKAVNRPAESSLGAVRVDGGRVFTVYTFKARTAYFSDTILMWVPMVQTFVWSFINACSEIICDALDMGILLRGAVAQGPGIMYRPNGIYVGKPLVWAAKLEKAQQWCGLTFHHSATWPPFLAEVHPTQIQEYDANLKPDSSSIASPVVLDWPRRWLETRQSSAAEAVRKLDVDPRFRQYYQNTVQFIEHSASNAAWYTQTTTEGPARRLRMVHGDEEIPTIAR